MRKVGARRVGISPQQADQTLPMGLGSAMGVDWLVGSVWVAEGVIRRGGWLSSARDQPCAAAGGPERDSMARFRDHAVLTRWSGSRPRCVRN